MAATILPKSFLNHLRMRRRACGWGDDLRAGLLTDDEILARLFHLNQKRAAAEKGGKA